MSDASPEEPPHGAARIVTQDQLFDGLTALGVERGSVVLVHTSLASFGHVVGGEDSVIRALRDVVGESGTIVMPAQSWQLCDPDFLDDPRWDATARAVLRDALPPYDADLTPTRSMGRVAELFRLQPGHRRSPHPHRSFSAAGPASDGIVREHRFERPFGEDSPLARLYDLDARILLLGVGFDRCTALHLAEERSRAGRPRDEVRNGAPVLIDGLRVWTSWREPVVDDRDFRTIGTAAESAGLVQTAQVGSALCRSVGLVDLVNFAQTWMTDSSSI